MIGVKQSVNVELIENYKEVQFMNMTGITISINTVRTRFIVHAQYVVIKLIIKVKRYGAPQVAIGQFQISAGLKKWMIKYLTMNKIYSIIITEREIRYT